MKQSPLDRYCSTIAFFLLVVFVWRLVSLGVHHTPQFALLFPLNWLKLRILTQYAFAPWWTEVEIAVTVFVWLFFYMLFRGVFNVVRSMEGLPLWLAFALYIFIALFAFFLLVLRPAFSQIRIWENAWPGLMHTVYPAGEGGAQVFSHPRMSLKETE